MVRDRAPESAAHRSRAERPARAHAPDPETRGHQARFDDFVDYFNHVRPHQALDMQVPADRYKESPRRCQSLTDLDYPFHDRSAIVTSCGRICIGRRKINLSTAFAGQTVGITEVED